jgi:hypothetical protein
MWTNRRRTCFGVFRGALGVRSVTTLPRPASPKGVGSARSEASGVIVDPVRSIPSRNWLAPLAPRTVPVTESRWRWQPKTGLHAIGQHQRIRQLPEADRANRVAGHSHRARCSLSGMPAIF